MTWGPETPDKTPYTQCRLERTADGKRTAQILWIPAKHAKKGKILRLKDDDGNWSSGWLVKEVFSTVPERPDAPDKLIRRHRKNTGDSLPKREP